MSAGRIVKEEAMSESGAQDSEESSGDAPLVIDDWAPVPFASVVYGVVQRLYNALSDYSRFKGLSEDVRRKQLYVLFESGRQAFIKLYVLHKYMSVIRDLDKFHNRLVFPRGIDQFYEMEIQMFSDRRYDLKNAIDILCANGYFSSLPRAVAGEAPKMTEERASRIIKHAHAAIREHVFFFGIPRVFSRVKVADGQLMLLVKGEYCAWLQLTPKPFPPASSLYDLPCDRHAFVLPWFVTRLDCLLPGVYASTTGSANDSWIFTLLNKINGILTATAGLKEPLLFLHKSVHTVLMEVRWKQIVLEALKLPSLMLPGCVLLDMRNPNAHVFSVRYWVDGTIFRRNPPCINFSQLDDGSIKVEHIPPIKKADGSSTVEFSLNGRPSSAVCELVYEVIMENSRRRLMDVCSAFNKGKDHFSVLASVRDDPLTRTPVLTLNLFSGHVIYVRVDIKTGDFVLNLSSGNLPSFLNTFLSKAPTLPDKVLSQALEYSINLDLIKRLAANSRFGYKLLVHYEGKRSMCFVDKTGQLKLTVDRKCSSSQQVSFHCVIHFNKHEHPDDSFSVDHPDVRLVAENCVVAIEQRTSVALQYLFSQKCLSILKKCVKDAKCIDQDSHVFCFTYRGFSIKTFFSNAPTSRCRICWDLPDEMLQLLLQCKPRAEFPCSVLELSAKTLSITSEASTVVEAFHQAFTELEFICAFCSISVNLKSDAKPRDHGFTSILLSIKEVPMSFRKNGLHFDLALPNNMVSYELVASSALKLKQVKSKELDDAVFDLLKSITSYIDFAKVLYDLFSRDISHPELLFNAQDFQIIPLRLGVLRCVFRNRFAFDFIIRKPYLLVRDFRDVPSLNTRKCQGMPLPRNGSSILYPFKTSLVSAPCLSSWKLSFDQVDYLAFTLSELHNFMNHVAEFSFQFLFEASLKTQCRALLGRACSFAPKSVELNRNGEIQIMISPDQTRLLTFVHTADRPCSMNISINGAHAGSFSISLFSNCQRSPAALASLSRIFCAPLSALRDIFSAYSFGFRVLFDVCELPQLLRDFPNGEFADGSVTISTESGICKMRVIVLPQQASSGFAYIPVEYSFTDSCSVSILGSVGQSPQIQSVMQFLVSQQQVVSLSTILSALTRK